jgi:[ribosomal protein S18]-alanine N-acetyltransferase
MTEDERAIVGKEPAAEPKELPPSPPQKDRSRVMHLFKREKQPKLFVRWVIDRDLSEILGIEHESFEFPWREEEFIGRLERRNCIGIVAEANEHVAGYMIYERNEGRIDLLNLAVDSKVRRTGVGKELMTQLIAKLSPSRHSRLLVSIRDSNLSAHLFFKSLGFRCVQVRHDCYENTADDAYDFVYDVQRQEPDYAGVGELRVKPFCSKEA